jgi:hypothetical protein
MAIGMHLYGGFGLSIANPNLFEGQLWRCHRTQVQRWTSHNSGYHDAIKTDGGGIFAAGIQGDKWKESQP